jgi:pilus assembly protein CpaB
MKLRAALIAIAVAALGGFLFWSYLQRYEAEVSGGPRVGVLVLMRSVEGGSMIRAEDLAERYIPQAYVEPRAVRIADKPRVTNLRTSAPLQAQQTLMWSDLVLASDDRQDVSALVQPGMRAVTIRAEGSSSALVRGGDRVDVIVTIPESSNSEQRKAIVLLQNVLVLGRGPDATASTRAGSEANDLALSLSLANAQLVAVAAERGKLSVAVRSPDDVRLQEGLADVSSSILADVERRAAAARPRPVGPVNLGAPR